MSSRPRSTHHSLQADRRLRDVIVAMLAGGRFPTRPIPVPVLSRALGIPRSTVYQAVANGRRILAGLGIDDLDDDDSDADADA